MIFFIILLLVAVIVWLWLRVRSLDAEAEIMSAQLLDIALIVGRMAGVDVKKAVKDVVDGESH